MEDFQFVSPTRFNMGRNAEDSVGAEVRRFSDKVLMLHYGNPLIHESGLYQRLAESFAASGVALFELTGIQPNPTVEPIREGIRICRENRIGCLLAVGGGSVIDTAKAIAAGVLYEGDVWDFYTHKAACTEALPVGVVMTIASTGSEGSNGSVITNAATGEKLDMMSDALRPAFVLMNPERTFTLPPRQTAAGIVDMFSHVTERYFSTSVETEATDRIGEGLMKAIIVNARKVMLDPKDYNARADLMWLSILAHNGLAGTGRNQDWACHAIGAPLSGEFNAVHGETISVLLPVWASYVYQSNLPRFVQFASRVFDVDIDLYDQKRTALRGIEMMTEFFRSLGMPLTLRALKIDSPAKLDELAVGVCRFGPVGGIRPLAAKDVAAIYAAAF